MTRYFSARELLREVVLRYRALVTYADTGYVRSLGKSRSPTTSFETAFRRPGDFRFRFSSPHPYWPKRDLISRSQVGLDDGKPYIWSRHYSGDPELEHGESLQMAIAGATGISAGSAFTIWSLLFGADGFDLFSTLARPRFRAFSNVDGVKCHRVTATHRYLRRVDIYIGVEDLLLRGWVTRPGRFPHAEVRTNIEVGPKFGDSFFEVPHDGAPPWSADA
ncbi:hypothetical protein ACIPRI_12565 [Variovorax sp. LARHSF232]